MTMHDQFGSLQRRSTVTESLDTSFSSSTDCIGLNQTNDSMKVLFGNGKKPNNIHFKNNIDHHLNSNSVNHKALHRPSLRSKHRLVEKDGKCNVVLENGISNWWWCSRFISDFFTTVVDMKWRYNFLMVVLGFLSSWILFGALYYGIAYGRDDFNQLNNSSHVPCFRNFMNWQSAFLYSLEAQTTIGFGFRSPQEQCWESIACLIMQVLWANFMEAFIIGAFIAKFSRPKMRASTLCFSKMACIAKHDDKMCFTFRIGDIRKSPIVEGHIRIQMVRHHITTEGIFIPYKFFDMDVGHETGVDRIFLVWPLLIAHVIDDKSPLYDISKHDLQNNADFEIVVILEGIVEATGTTTQARTSYIPSEIQWGYFFDNMINERKNKHFVDMDKFDWIRPMPEFSPLSAEEIAEEERLKQENTDDNPVWEEQTEETRPSRPTSMVNHVDVESRL